MKKFIVKMVVPAVLLVAIGFLTVKVFAFDSYVLAERKNVETVDFEIQKIEVRAEPVEIDSFDKLKVDEINFKALGVDKMKLFDSEGTAYAFYASINELMNGEILPGDEFHSVYDPTEWVFKPFIHIPFLNDKEVLVTDEKHDIAEGTRTINVSKEEVKVNKKAHGEPIELTVPYKENELKKITERIFNIYPDGSVKEVTKNAK